MNGHENFQTWLISNPGALTRLWACKDAISFQQELQSLADEQGFALEYDAMLAWPSLNRRPRQR